MSQDDLTEPAVPAATVVLLRDTAGGVETLMLRRDTELAFAGGAWVFPGGRIDAEDFPEGTDANDPDAVFQAARNAAAREAMEEAGLSVDPEGFVWFAHWTPPTGSGTQRRFATWFFAARAPSGDVVVDDGEIRDHQWIRPADALRRRDAGEVLIIPPTWITLNTLAHAGSVDDLLAVWRRVSPTCMSPVWRAGLDGVMVSMWAGDAGYDDGDAERPGSRHRLIMSEDGWRFERNE